MELIIKEPRRGREWYYHDGEYISKSGDTVFARLKGDLLPCPEELKFKRMQVKASLPLNTRGLYRTDPDPITVALWNDWQSRKSI